jgi:hypothetical protein
VEEQLPQAVGMISVSRAGHAFTTGLLMAEEIQTSWR